jgi:two-component system sensor histidine kinase BaeS
MKLGVTHKLFLAILAASGLAVICSALIMQWRLNRGFHNYLNSIEKAGISRLAATLEKSYGTEQGWGSLAKDHEHWRQLVVSSFPMPPLEEIPPGERMPPPAGMTPGTPEEHADQNRAHPHGLLPPPMAHRFDQRLYLLDADKRVVVSRVMAPDASSATPLRYRGAVVGYLGIMPRTRQFADEPQRRFIKDQEQALTLTAGVVVLLAAILSLLMARRLVRPLRELAAATHRLSSGVFSVRVPISSRDELGELAGDFNSLALTLEKNEESRRQWVADISHELRTPLAILRGEIEAIQDGIRQPTQQTIQSLHGEVLHLGRLVDDLYQLSMSDVGALTYRKSELDLGDVLSETVAAFRPELSSKGITIVATINDTADASVFGDPERLRQLFTNLLKNSLKYTDAGGTLIVRLQASGGMATVDFQDSPPAVPPAEMERLFERLYRVDSSRNRSTGGAGLGLAICRNIVEAHAGSITARPSPLGGLWIRIEIPRKGAT